MENTIPRALLEKLKLLPLRERELSTLRQLHQHQIRWIEGTQELMVRLASASSISDAIGGVVESLVEEFEFDLSAAATPDVRLAGDAVRALAPADRAMLDQVVEMARARNDLVVLAASDAQEHTLAWLLAGPIAGGDAGEDLVVCMGRTVRTAPYYPAPNNEDISLYRHLLSTVTQVFRSIALQANHQSELERKVAERTAELHAAQQRVIELEKEKTAEQMAGGFAHEMRNALSGAKILLEKGMGGCNRDGKSVIDESAEHLRRILVLAQRELAAESVQELRDDLSVIVRNEGILDEVLSSVNVSIGRALAITTLIMEYSRIGCSARGDKPVDVTKVARSIIDESAATCLKHGIVARLHVEDACHIRGHESHIYSIVKNLVLNAMDALTELAPDRLRTLIVEVQHLDDQIVCRVQDNAGGIAEGLQARIFEPFFSTKPRTGTGLGLSVVQKLVGLHEGRLHVESCTGLGTTFSVSLPALSSTPVDVS